MIDKSKILVPSLDPSTDPSTNPTRDLSRIEIPRIEIPALDLEKYLNHYQSILKQTEILNSLIQTTQTHPHTQVIAHMISGPQIGAILKFLAQLIQARSILEIGTFTGYATLCLAESFEPWLTPNLDSHLAPELAPQLITLEINPISASIAQTYFNRSIYKKLINLQICPATDWIQDPDNIQNLQFDLIFCDADKSNYLTYYRSALKLLRPGGILIFDNALVRGEILNPVSNAAKNIHALNETVTQDDRVVNFILPVRDGLLIIYKL